MAARNEIQDPQGHVRYKPSGFFLLRTPVLPFDDFANWAANLRAALLFLSELSSPDTPDAVLEDIVRLRQRMHSIIDKPIIRQAIFLSSPSLESAIRYWLDDPTTKKGSQVERALTRYFARMAGRSTPFGLFSASSFGTIGMETRLVVAPLSECRTSSSMDFRYLDSLTDSLQSEFRDHLRWWPNSSFLKVGDSFRYIQSKKGNEKSSHTSVRLRADKYLRAILNGASGGASLGVIARHLRSSFEELLTVPDEEINDYLQTCVVEEILVTDVSPQSTGVSALDDAFHALDSFPEGASRARAIRAAQAELQSIDRKGIPVSTVAYKPILDRLKSLSPFSLAELPIQVNLFRPLVQSTVDSRVAASMLSGVTFLSKIGASPVNPDRKLRKFRLNFRERYGAAWVPLEYALDHEFGIGLDRAQLGGTSPFLTGIQAYMADTETRSGLTPFHRTMISKLFRGNREIDICQSDFDGQTLIPTQLPDAFSLTGTIMASPELSNASKTPCVILRAAAGPSGVLTMGRLAHLDPLLEASMLEHIQHEERLQPDAVFAEVTYLPRGRIGNILFRPRLRRYEIPYLSHSQRDDESQIEISDLLVTVAPDDDIILYSKRLQKRVVPRLSSAHQFTNTMWPAVYRFLCYLQYEPSKTVPLFNWGPLGGLPFLPRVRFENLILSLATWNLSRKDIDGLLESITTQDAFMWFQAIRRKLDLPRWVSLAEGDQLLPVDLDNPLSVESVAQLIRRSGTARLQELPEYEELCVTAEEGRYHHELTIPYVRQASVPQKDAIPESLRNYLSFAGLGDKLKRTFLPGSLWTYFKIYAGFVSLDEFIAWQLPKMIDSLKSRHGIEEWFFVRYEDPESHLRIRFKSSAHGTHDGIIASVHRELQPLLVQGSIWKVELGTYEREIERYGGLEGMELSEQVFAADSAAVLRIVSKTLADENPMLRWQTAILGIDRYLADAKLGYQDRLRLCKDVRNHLQKEFRPSRAMLGVVASKVRENRMLLDEIVNSTAMNGTGEGLDLTAFEERSGRVCACMRSLRDLDAYGKLAVTFESILSSYIHMFLNRLFAEEQRLHEFVLYSMLVQAYEGQRANEGAQSTI
jgi:lantibiotic biosynthesis protein